MPVNAINPSRSEFADLVAACGTGPIPFVVRLPNDTCTPVGTYANVSQTAKHSFFFESVELGLRQGRYSFMGAKPRRIYTCSNGMFRVCDGDNTLIEEFPSQDPITELENAWKPWKAQWPNNLHLPPLVGGLVGYMGYDCVHYFEPVGKLKPDAIGMPEMTFMLVDYVLCFDHLHSEILLARCLPPNSCADKDLNDVYDQTVEQIEQIAAAAMKPAPIEAPNVRAALRQSPDLPEDVTSNIEPQDYLDIVERCKHHIFKGDIFQVVPSQRFSTPIEINPQDIYRALRKINPSQYMFVLELGDVTAVGSSPEMQLRCINDHLQVRPIAGTRARGSSAGEDKHIASGLLADAKEIAEHKMLVDLARNDLGRVAKTGSVKIDWLMRTENYSHVMHITSSVSAHLDISKFTSFDALRATFPAGTLSGAPKVRAMQLINDFEPVRRNLYGGLVGYIDLCGNIDTCIAIRMLVTKDGKAHVQAGGGIVADSKPQAELDETKRKSMAVMRAIAEAVSR